MSSNISIIFPDAITLTAGASSFVDYYLDDVFNMQCLLTVVYPLGTSSSTGVAVRLKGGFGPADPAITQTPIPYAANPGASGVVFGDNYESVAMTPVPISYGGALTTKTNFYLDSVGVKWPRWVRMEFINQDASKACTVALRADI